MSNKKYKGVIVDLDGIVWRGNRPLKNNIEALRLLHQRGVRIIFLSNNATRSRAEYLEKLRSLGLPADMKNMINSGFAATYYLRGKNGKKVFIIGEAGLFYEATINGLIPVSIGTEADHVIVGLDRFLTYDKLAWATILIRQGATFIATNTDATLPHNDEELPGAGSIVAFLETATGKKPDIIIGKPNPWILELALKLNNLEKQDVLIIGDRLDTDILLGVKSGVDTLLVLTGVSSIDDIERLNITPTYVAKDLKSFVEEFNELFQLATENHQIN